ncbi:MAG TPA: preprotein translocase subunit SecE [Desulfobacterales bacterium]|nr:preprotein translocase subunit SecE [Desulfobacterales bacterium]
MGRILRKKPTSLKKKRRHEDETSGVAPASENGAASLNSGLTAGADSAAGADRRPALVPKKPQAASAQAPATPPADNVYTRAVQFLREVKIELKKVTWPTRKQTLGSTAVVIVLVTIISVFLGLVDVSLGNLVRAVFK